ncbi:MAG: Ig-like domain-containing protein, partial [Pirellulales bacterium]
MIKPWKRAQKNRRSLSRQSGLRVEGLERRLLLAAVNDSFSLAEDTTLVSNAPGTLVSMGAVWNYLDDGSNQGTAWRGNAYDDSSWASGPARLGYGGDGEVTTVGFGPDSGNKYVTTYFRYNFDLSAGDLSSMSSTIGGELLYDDAGVVFVNGVEVARIGDWEGIDPILFDTRPNGPEVGNGDTDTFSFSKSLLQAGENVIAVEIHQVASGSSDISFDLSASAADPGVAPILQNDDGDFGSPLFFPFVEIIEGVENGTLSLSADGSFTYTPNLNFVGTDDFVYRVSDQELAAGFDDATVTLTVTAVPDPPLAVDDEYFVVTDETLTVTAPTGVILADAGLLGPAGGSTWQYLDTLSNGLDGSAIDNYPANWEKLGFDASSWESGAAMFVGGDDLDEINAGTGATLIDGMQDVGDDTNSVTTHLFRHNFSVTGAAGITTLIVDLLADDGGILYVNGVEVLRHRIASGPVLTTQFANSTSSDDAGENGHGRFFVNVSNILNEGSNNVFAFELHQGNATSSDAGFDIHITTAPIITANDFDPDTGGGVTGAVVVDGVQNGSLNFFGGAFSYTPDEGFEGTDTFTYTVMSGVDTSNVATVSIHVGPDPSGPTASDDSYTVAEDGVLDVTLTSIANPVVLVHSGQLAPAAATTWSYLSRLNDNPANTSPAEDYPANWNQPGFNDAAWPTGESPFQADSPEGSTVDVFDDSYTTLPGSQDLDTGASNSVTTTLFRTEFNVTDAAAISELFMDWVADDGMVVYINGVEVFRTGNLDDEYILNTTDQTGGDGVENAYTTDTLDVAGLLVNGVNTLAVELHDNEWTSSDFGMDIQLSFVPAAGILANDDLRSLAVESINIEDGVDNGVLMLNQDGTFTYTPTAGFDGEDTFTYTYTAGGQTTNLATVTITVANIDPVAVDDTYLVEEDGSLAIDFAGRGTGEEIIPEGSIWKYLDDGSNQGTAWRTLGYSDAAWNSGPGQLGYGDGDEKTVVSDGGGADVNPTTYFRHSFSLTAGELSELDVLLNGMLLYDDAGVVYVNGTEVHRSSDLDGLGEIAFDQYTGSNGDNARDNFTFSKSLLQEGNNVIAVEIHQTNATSSDLSFDFALRRQLGVLGNDDLRGLSPATVSLVDDVENGTLTLNNDGTFTYTPELEFSGTDTFTYMVSAEGQTSNVATVTLEIIPDPVDPVAVDDSYSTPQNTPITTTSPTALPPTVLLHAGILDPATVSTWQYLDTLENGVDAEHPVDDYPAGWETIGFDDSGWSSGVVPFEAGTINAFDGYAGTITPLEGVDDATNGTSNSITTYLFRNTFDVTGAASTGSLSMDYVADDAIVVYINNIEVFRSDTLPEGELATTDFATPDGNEDSFTTVMLDVAGLLEEGTNTIAVELHQTNLTSSDAGFDLQLSQANPNVGILGNDDLKFGLPTDIQILDDVDSGDLVLNANGTFTYTPDNNFVGTDTFTYRVETGAGLSNTATVTFAVTGVGGPDPATIEGRHIFYNNSFFDNP